MTLRLILTRHAKSSWDDPLMSDHDRPLNARGKAAAADLGGWLASRSYLPGQVLCSDALRTRETWEGIAPALAAPPVAEIKAPNEVVPPLVGDNPPVPPAPIVTA